MKKRGRIPRARRGPEIPPEIVATLGSRREIEARRALLLRLRRGYEAMGADLIGRNEAFIALFDAVLRGDSPRAIEAAADRVIEVDGRIDASD